MFIQMLEGLHTTEADLLKVRDLQRPLEYDQAYTIQDDVAFQNYLRGQGYNIPDENFLIDKAKENGADAIKFQMHMPEFESSKLEKFRKKFFRNSVDGSNYTKSIIKNYNIDLKEANLTEDIVKTLTTDDFNFEYVDKSNKFKCYEISKFIESEINIENAIKISLK